VLVRPIISLGRAAAKKRKATESSEEYVPPPPPPHLPVSHGVFSDPHNNPTLLAHADTL
jgi:hypothetical protein